MIWINPLEPTPIPNRPLLLGHRGARGNKSVPENTLASFDLALRHGCDGFEFDVRASAEGHPVVVHDATIDGLEVSRCAAQELALPDLGAVLQRYQESAFLDIELKIPGLESALLGLLRQFPPVRGCVISSFLPAVLRAIREQDPSAPLGLICETRDQLARWSRLPLQCVIPHYSLVTQSLICGIHAAGGRVFVWTVNAGADVQRFAEWGVDAIISDDPERLTAALGHRMELRNPGHKPAK